jgi:RimJ/RimL family protein N-acetyltransferase
MPHNDIPVLETERLLLRGPTPDDYPQFQVMFGSRHSRFMGGPLTEYETWMLYAAEIGHWRIRGYGMWTIEDKANGANLGMTGAWFPAGYPEPEIAWMIWPSSEGRGIAMESTLAARKYLHTEHGFDCAVSFLDPKNFKSSDLARRLGCVKDTDIVGADSHEIAWRHPSSADLAAVDVQAAYVLAERLA